MTPQEIEAKLVQWNYETALHIGKDIFKVYTRRGDGFVRAYIEDKNLVIHDYSFTVTSVFPL